MYRGPLRYPFIVVTPIETGTILTAGSGLTTWLHHITDLVTSHHQFGYAIHRQLGYATQQIIYATPPNWLRHSTNLFTPHEIIYVTPPTWLRHTTNLFTPHTKLATPHHQIGYATTPTCLTYFFHAVM